MTQQEQRAVAGIWLDDDDQAAIIEADRAATRAAVVAEICEWLREQDCIERYESNHADLWADEIAKDFGGRDDV